jgi:glycosyltransferase involved in cell wall biosynthesis
MMPHFYEQVLYIISRKLTVKALRKKIAILAFHFYPDEAVGSVRPQNWAEWLSHDNDVYVVTRGRLPEGVYPKTPYKVIRKNNFMLSLVEKFNGIKKRIRNRAFLRAGKLTLGSVTQRRKLSGVFSYRMPCLYDLWFFSSYAALRAIKPEVVIATHSPYVSLLAAWVYTLRNKNSILWVDFRDLWTGNHTVTGTFLFRRLERYLERKVLASASAVTTVSNGLAERLDGAKYGAKVVYNAPSGSIINALNCSKKSSYDPRRPIQFCYTGTVYSGWQDPSMFFEFISSYRSRKPPNLNEVRFCVASRNVGNLLSLAEAYGVKDFIDFKGALSRNEAMALQQESDVLVLLESSSSEVKGVLTGKVFEYLATDKPILLIGPGPDSELYQLLKHHRRLITLSEIESILLNRYPLPEGQRINYGDTSRKQLMQILREICGYRS